MKQWIEMVKVKILLVIPNYSYQHFSEVIMSMSTCLHVHVQTWSNEIVI